MATILLVDDDQSVRQTIMTCVLAGIPGELTIQEAESAAGGFDHWKRRRGGVDLIITELRFCTGSMSGQDMIDLIRVGDPDIPIIVVASMDDESDRDAVHDATHVFAKPFKINELMRAVMDALSGAPAAVSG